MRTRFMYLRDENRNPIGCVAMHINETSIDYAVSIKNPKDTFNRVLARKIAQGRLDNHAINLICNAVDCNTGHSINTIVMNAISNDLFAHSRSRKAAKFWLNNRFNSIS